MNEDPEFLEEACEAFSAKVWDECLETFTTLPIDEQAEIIRLFGEMIEEHGAESCQIRDYFDMLSMKFSKTYYFVTAMAGSHNGDWDKAVVNELS